MLYGRDLERAQIGALLEAARDSQSGALVVRGEPGVGKSALLADARDRAADLYVLAARGVESESELPFAALHQLLRPALDQLDAIPPPQAAALRGALGLAESDGQERFLIFAGCLSMLSELAERRPVLCLIDDAHWLDEGSADALRFVARRLHGEGVAMLFGAREGDVRQFEAPDLPTLVVEGLGADAAATLLARAAGVEPPEAVRDALVARTGGNALALMELPSALTSAQLRGDERLPDTLPLTREVEQIFLGRVRRLSAAAQQFLLVAATDDTESAAVVVRASGAAGGAEALDETERAGLVKVRGDRLEFRHPLVRSAVQEGATSAERRDAHRALAAALADDAEQADRRAWHLAWSTLEHDESVVAALDAAAARATERGAHAAASRALERAAELSTDAERGVRLVRAAQASSAIGSDDDRAGALAAQARPLVEDPLLRAALAEVEGTLRSRHGRPADAFPLFMEAATELADSDPRRALELLMWSLSTASDSGIDPMFESVEELIAKIGVPDGDLRAELLHCTIAGCVGMALGHSERGAPLLARAVEIAHDADDEQDVYWASAAALWLGDDEGVDALLTKAIKLARARGSVAVLVEALGFRAAQLALSQRHDAAMSAAVEGVALAREIGSENRALLPLSTLAAINGIRGNEDECRRLSAEGYERATANGLAVRAANAVYALALLDLGAGRYSEALERLDALSVRRPGFGDQFFVVITARDRIEAAMRVGRLDTARESLAIFETWATASGAAWAQLELETARALASDEADAAAHYEEALRHADGARPLDLARSHLLYGEHLRRQRRRVDARPHLRAALEGFEAMKATPWAERARAELRASGETARKRDPSTASELTPQEQQIAALVAEGLSNKEIAAQMFLSPRTIDAHLRSVFNKLGITSRTQVARHLTPDRGAPVAV